MKKIIIDDIFLLSERNQKNWEKYDYPKTSIDQIIRLNKNHNLLCLYGKPEVTIDSDSIKIDNDLIGTAFVFLSRIEELNKNHDKFGRYKYKNSIADRFQIITRPIVNEYIEFIKDALKYLEPKILFKKYDFDVILTHDIDMIKKWNIRGIIKHSIFNFMKRGFVKIVEIFFFQRKDYTADPYYNFTYIMNASKKYNLYSTFLFMALEKDEFDFRYSLEKAEAGIKSILKKEGNNIGIHLSRISYNNFENANIEIKRLKKISGKNVIYNRFHYLMFDIKNSWNILEKNKIKYDLSLGFPEVIGFRCGICYPFKVFDLKRKKLNVTEIPLNIMDVTITGYMIGLENEKKDKIISDVINNIKKYNGILNLLWHNNSCI